MSSVGLYSLSKSVRPIEILKHYDLLCVAITIMYRQPYVGVNPTLGGEGGGGTYEFPCGRSTFATFLIRNETSPNDATYSEISLGITWCSQLMFTESNVMRNYNFWVFSDSSFFFFSIRLDHFMSNEF